VKIGFAIVTYNEPEQLLRLVKTLNAMFGDPPIACHHDFGQCPLERSVFPRNVQFVIPHHATKWGHLSVCLAALKAFRLLKDHHEPDWFILLSGSDYPVRPAVEIIAELCGSHFDAYMDYREILLGQPPPDQTSDIGFDRPEWIPLAHNRYCSSLLWWPKPSKSLLIGGILPFRRSYISIKNPRIESVVQLLHLGRSPRIFGGDFWFQANRKAMHALLNPKPLRKLVRYFRGREIPEESLFHTALCGNSALNINKHHRRFANWAGNGRHPQWLEI
jgi:hypothetical protein